MSREELQRAHDDIKANWLKCGKLKVSTIPTALTALRSELDRVDGCVRCERGYYVEMGMPLKHFRYCPMCGKELHNA